jgi:hypothetical protein
MLMSASDSDGMNPSGPNPPNRADAALARDAAMVRVGHARRWVILASAGLSAGFAALVAASPPSNASTTKAKTTPAAPAPVRRAAVTRKGQAPALPPLADGTQLGLQGPGEAPGSDNNGGQVAPQTDPSQQQSQSAPAAQPAPSPQPGPVSGGS